MSMTINVDSILMELEDVQGQVEAAQGKDREDLKLGQKCGLMSTILTDPDNVAKFVSLDVDREAVYSAANFLDELNKLLNPQAVVLFNRDEVLGKLDMLEGGVKAGLFPPEIGEKCASIRQSLKVKPGGGTGVRAPREAQESIEGRPAAVEIYNADGERLSRQRGDTKTSASNVKTRALTLIKTALNLESIKDIDSGVSADIEEAVNAVVVNGEDSYTVHGLTFTAAE